MITENNDIYTGQQRSPLISIPIKKFPPKSPPNIAVSIVIQTEIRSSEDPELVLRALKTLFPDASFNIEDSSITGRFIDLKILNYFVERVYHQQILDAVRKAVYNGVVIDHKKPHYMTTTEFYINKQVALSNRIVICEPNESPLGPITIRIISESLLLIIDLYFPKWEWFFENPIWKNKEDSNE